jgi:single-strand DNA-binding protein
MSGSINKVILIGNLGRDPEVRLSQDGKKIVNFSIATSESWKDKTSGERREKTEWHRIVIFSDGLAGIAERFLKKGSKVYLEGTLQTRKWTGNDGIEKYTTEVVLQGFNSTLTMLDGRGEGGGGGDYTADSSSYGGGSDNNVNSSDNIISGNAPSGDLDDEIPF